MSWFATVVIVGVLASSVSTLIDKNPALSFVVVGLLALSGVAVWVWLNALIRHRRTMKPSRLRSRRLDRIIADTRTPLRLPHRHIEHCLRSLYSPQRKVARLLRHLEPRQIIVVNGPRLGESPRPVSTDVHFEPVDIAADCEGLNWLVSQNLEEQGSASIAKRGEAPSRGNAREVAVKTLVPLVFTALFLGLCYCVYVCITRRSLGSIIILTFFFIMLLGPVVVRGIAETRWWLVPGGLAYRKHRSWRRGSVTGLITPDDTTLVLDLRTGRGMLLEGEHVHRFRFVLKAGWPLTAVWGIVAVYGIVAGWTSRASCPTLAQVSALVNSTPEQ